MGILNAVVVV